MREKIFTKINGRSKTLQRNVKVGDNLQRGQGCFVLVKDSWCHGQKFFDAKMCFFSFANFTFLGVWGNFRIFSVIGPRVLCTC